MTRDLLDSSFVIDLLNEIADHDSEGAALHSSGCAETDAPSFGSAP